MALPSSMVLTDIRSDPWWYAAILRHRAFATVTLEKLWPWEPRDGQGIAASTHPQQGDLDKYYRLTRPVDWFVIGRQNIEAPVPLMLLPTAALFAIWFRARYLRRRSMAGTDSRASRGLGFGGAHPFLVLACPVVAALGVPILVSTAGALETQAFALVYFLGMGFFLQEVSRGVVAMMTSSSKPLAPVS